MVTYKRIEKLCGISDKKRKDMTTKDLDEELIRLKKLRKDDVKTYLKTYLKEDKAYAPKFVIFTVMSLLYFISFFASNVIIFSEIIGGNILNPFLLITDLFVEAVFIFIGRIGKKMIIDDSDLFSIIKSNNNLIKECKKELRKSKIIDKIKEINKEEVNGINIDRKQQQLVDKLLGKLKKITSEEEYQTKVDEIFNERVQLEEDEYTITEDNPVSIESGNMAYSFPTDQKVNKKVLVR